MTKPAAETPGKAKQTPMWTRCPFCHEQVPTAAYPEHERGHIRLRADGQMNEHITLPPEQRVQGDLSGVPRVYYHPKCGGRTGMPEEVIRSYLRDPFLYNGLTFCTGCHCYVPEGELFWTETNESLAIYMRRLKHGAKALRGSGSVLPPAPPARREFSGWRVLVLLLILVVVVPALVIDTGIALHFLTRPSPVSTPPSVVRTPVSGPMLTPPVILSTPVPPPPVSVPDNAPLRFRPDPAFLARRPASDEAAAIQDAALADVPDYIRQFHPVQSPTGRLTVTSSDVLRTSESGALVTVHYEIRDSDGVQPPQPGAARILLQRIGPRWTAVSAAPLGGG